MDITDRFRGDTRPLVMFLSEVTDGVETPVPLIANNCTVVFSFRKDKVTDSIIGINLTDLGEVHFPFAADTVQAGKYEYDVQVTDGAGEITTYVKADMIIKSDVTK